MSLDLSAKSGVAFSTSAITSVAGFAAGIFDADKLGQANQFVVKVDATAGQVDLSALGAPSSFAFIADGDVVTFLKTDASTNGIKVDDATPGANFNGASGTIYDYVNRRGESVSVVADTGNGNWGVSV